MKGEVGTDAADDELVEGSAHPRDCFVARRAVGDDLRQEGIVNTWNFEASVDPRVDPHAATTMDRPSPVPLPSFLVEKNGSTAFFSVAASMPAPVSATRMRT